MKIFIESERDLTDGLLPHIASSPRFPHRIITARYQGPWESDAMFAAADKTSVSPIYHSLFALLALQPIDPKYEWAEVSLGVARKLVYQHVRQSPAYEIELRSDEEAQAVTSRIVRGLSHTRYFSNHDAMEQDGKLVNHVCPGGQLTDHTFEFAIVAIRPDSLVLFLTCDED
jgi:hypothetical protein